MKLFFEASKNKDPTTRLFCKYLHQQFDTFLKYHPAAILCANSTVKKVISLNVHLVAFLQTELEQAFFVAQKLQLPQKAAAHHHWVRTTTGCWLSISRGEGTEGFPTNHGAQTPTRRKSWSCVFLQRIWPCTLRSVSYGPIKNSPLQMEVGWQNRKTW